MTVKMANEVREKAAYQLLISIYKRVIKNKLIHLFILLNMFIILCVTKPTLSVNKSYKCYNYNQNCTLFFYATAAILDFQNDRHVKNIYNIFIQLSIILN